MPRPVRRPRAAPRWLRAEGVRDGASGAVGGWATAQSGQGTGGARGGTWVRRSPLLAGSLGGRTRSTRLSARCVAAFVLTAKQPREGHVADPQRRRRRPWHSLPNAAPSGPRAAGRLLGGSPRRTSRQETGLGPGPTETRRAAAGEGLARARVLRAPRGLGVDVANAASGSERCHAAPVLRRAAASLMPCEPRSPTARPWDPRVRGPARAGSGRTGAPRGTQGRLCCCGVRGPGARDARASAARAGARREQRGGRGPAPGGEGSAAHLRGLTCAAAKQWAQPAPDRGFWAIHKYLKRRICFYNAF